MPMTNQCGRWRALALVVSAGGAISACSGGSSAQPTTASPPVGATASNAAQAAAAIAAPTTTAVAATGSGGPVTIAFAGDVHGESPISGVLARGGNPLSAVAPIFQRADIAMVNLETTIGNAGAKVPKEFNFRSDNRLLTALKAAGVDVVTVANNHSFDYGLAGFTQTLESIKASGLQVVGGGANAAAAYAPAIIDVRGVKVALLGIAVIGPNDIGRANSTRPGTTNGRDVNATLAAIRSARAQASIVVAFMHWDVELATCPTAEDRALAQQMLDAGASAVIGAHPHVLQGLRTPAAGKLIAYSLGNFVFYAKKDVARRTGVLTVTFAPDGSVTGNSFDPATIDGSGRPIPLTGAARANALADYMALGGPRCFSQ
jgi:hypothetical protein